MNINKPALVGAGVALFVLIYFLQDRRIEVVEDPALEELSHHQQQDDWFAQQELWDDALERVSSSDEDIGGSNGSNNNNDDAWFQAIQSKHPDCFSNDLLERDDDTGRLYLDVQAVGRFVKSPSKPYRYNHMTCRVMKSRYNCVGKSNKKTARKVPPHVNKKRFTLVLSRRNNNMTTCDLTALMDDLQGPIGVARYFRQQPQKTVSFYFHGVSFVRQMWEAAVCSWRSNITDLIVRQHGTHASDFIHDKNLKVGNTPKELGKPIFDAWNEMLINDNNKILAGCHGSGNEWMGRYYQGVKVPTQIANECNDDYAMVEFNENVRLYYMFHPEQYQNVSHVLYDILGMEPSNLHACVATKLKQTREQLQIIMAQGESKKQQHLAQVMDRSLQLFEPVPLMRI